MENQVKKEFRKYEVIITKCIIGTLLAAGLWRLSLQADKPKEVHDNKIATCLVDQGIKGAQLAEIPTLDYSPVFIIKSQEVPYRSPKVIEFTIAVDKTGRVFNLDPANKWAATPIGKLYPNQINNGRMLVNDAKHLHWEGPERYKMASAAAQTCFASLDNR